MTTIILIGLVVMALASTAALALFQNAKDADEAWEESLRNKQNKDIK